VIDHDERAVDGRSPAPAATIVFAEDDRATRQSVTLALELEGYLVRAAGDGEKALELIGAHRPDLVVLDLGLPYVDGLTICRTLRAQRDRTPILALTARAEVGDRVAGLDAGADDYLAKPFAVEELLARVRALLRRTAPDEAPLVLIAGDLSIDEERRQVHRGQSEIELTRTEFDLLALLARHVNIVLSHSRIYEEIWGVDFVEDSNNLAVYIGYLRRKLEQGGATRLVHTVRGVGYTLRP